MSDPFGLKSQFISAGTRKFKKFVGNAMDTLSNGRTSLEQVARLNQNLSKYSTEHLEFPLGVSAGDPGFGNHGHYIMFYINEQTNAKLSTSGNTGADESIITGNLESQYNIPKYVKEWNSVTERYEKNKASIQKTVNQTTDPIAQRQGTTPPPATDGGVGTGAKAGGSTIRVQRRSTRRLKTGIAMYMPASVSVTYSTDYTDTEVGAVTENALKAYDEFRAKNYGKSAEAIAGASKGASEGLQKMLLGTVGVLPGFQGTREAFEMRQGEIISDRLELAFKGLKKREFQYTFKMIPKNQKEADEIRKIIFAFKANMLPEFKGGDRGGRRLIVPNTFDIQYMYSSSENQYLHHISTCVLDNMTVNYGGERYKTFNEVNGEGAPPVETSIALSFKEMELITRERVFEGY